MTADPVDIVREGYARYSQRNIAGVFELLSPDIHITQTTLPFLLFDRAAKRGCITGLT